MPGNAENTGTKCIECLKRVSYLRVFIIYVF